MPLRVISASAGSGKTQALATFTLFGLRNASAASSSGVLAITFTRNAAAELRERILRRADDYKKISLLRQIILGQAPLYTSTIDAFTREVYYRLAPLLGLPAYTALIVEAQDTAEATFAVVEAMLGQLSEPVRLRLLRNAMQAYLWEKSKRVFPEQLLEEAVENQLREGPIRSRIRLALYEWISQLTKPDSTELPWYKLIPLKKRDAALAQWVYQAMQAYREASRKLFLSDMQAVVQLVARNAPFLLAEQTSFFSQIFIDEAQDTSPAQWELLQPIFDELWGRGGWVTLIGDPKQSIYAWRDADFRQLLAYEKKASHKLFLTTNYRSHKRVVRFNNALYTQLPFLLERSLLEKHKPAKKGKSISPERIKAIDELKSLYKRASVWQSVPPSVKAPGRSTRAPGRHIRKIILPSEADDQKLQRVLKRILKKLKRRNIPPEQTAFLVRSNKDIRDLFRILPSYPLQLQSVNLETCTTLAATMALLEEAALPEGCIPSQAPSVEVYFLLQQPNAKDLRQALSELQKTFVENPASSLQKWVAFQKVGELWLENKNYCGHRLFWNSFLSELYNFLAKHPFYGLPEVLRWWRSRAAKISVEFPPTKGVYPVLTIHKAKGLAWEAVILPFVSWELLRARAGDPRWRRVPKTLSLPPSLERILQEVEDLAYSDAWELLLKVTKDSEAPTDLYIQTYATMVVEGVNLHYVATTRPKKYLFLIAKKPSGKGYQGVNTWSGFWAETKSIKT